MPKELPVDSFRLSGRDSGNLNGLKPVPTKFKSYQPTIKVHAMQPFHSQDYGPAVTALIDGDRLNTLGPGNPNQSAQVALEKLEQIHLFGDQVVADPDMANCCLSGLWLWHDFLELSHNLSQAVDTPSGSYWHGIMHRREPDFPNSKYWFRRVDDHPMFPMLDDAAKQIASAADVDLAGQFLVTQETWDPFHFIDFCEKVLGTGTESEQLARQIARREWQILFSYCYHSAVE